MDLEFGNKMSVKEIYNITRGIMMTVHKDDLLLLYVLTRLHPKLPEHISERYKHKMGKNNRIFSIKEEVFKEADEFIVQAKVGVHILASQHPFLKNLDIFPCFASLIPTFFSLFFTTCLKNT